MLDVGALLYSGVIGLCFTMWAVVQLSLGSLRAPEVLYMAVLVVLSSCLLPCCVNLWWAYLLLEVLSLCSYGLVYNGSVCEYSAEAGVKYYVLGAVSSLLFLASALVLHTGLGVMTVLSLVLFPVGIWAVVDDALAVFTVLLWASVLFKLAVAPVHAWFPEVLEGCHGSVAVLLLAVPKVALVG